MREKPDGKMGEWGASNEGEAAFADSAPGDEQASHEEPALTDSDGPDGPGGPDASATAAGGAGDDSASGNTPSGNTPGGDSAGGDSAGGDSAGDDSAGDDSADGNTPDDLSGDQRKAVWKQLQSAIARRIQPEQFETWFRRAALTRVGEESVCIALQNTFARDWLLKYYLDTLHDAVAEILGGKRKVEFQIDAELTHLSAEQLGIEEEVSGTASEHRLRRSDERNFQPDSFAAPASERRNGGQAARLSLGGNGAARDPGKNGFDGRDFHSNGLVRGSDIGLNHKYTFENYVVGPCNRFAHAAAVGAAESPGHAYNPLFLHGSVGLGKTHLLQSLCHALLSSYENIRILFLSCETFVNHFIGALENGDLQKFRTKYRNVDVLVVDDIHLLANKERTQEEFFHTFNTLYNAGKQIVLSSDSPPKEIPTLQQRLVSRFAWGLVTEMEPPCYETRMAILKRKSRERGREVPEEVASLLAERIDTNIRELEGAVTKLLTYAAMTQKPVSTDLARVALPEIFVVRRGQPSMEEIINLVTGHFGVKLAELQSKRRTNTIAYPRQIAMYLARKITRHSLAEIGGFFGGRDHSTVVHAVDKIHRAVGDDLVARDLVNGFLDDLQSRN